MEMKYGYLPSPIEEEHHIYGGGHNPQKVIINPTGDYRPYAPAFEPQALKFETWACTVFSILRAIATQYKLLTGKEINFSERAIYILAQIREPGADPHKVAEIIRNNGLIPQEKLPMTDSYAEFITPDPLDVALLILGQQFLNEWEIKHEWVWPDNEPQLNKKNKLKEIMKYGTVCVSVCAWKKNGKFYTKSEFDRDNHFTFLEFIDDKNLNHIFDSYETDHKVLEPDYNFERAKVFFLFKRTEPRDPQKQVKIGILTRIINFLKELLDKKKDMTRSQELLEVAKESLGKDITSDLLVPDEVSCAFAVSTLIKRVKLDMPIIIGTGELYRYMKENTRIFREIAQPIGFIEAGLIVIAPTGLNSRPEVMPHGHVCISGEGETYMSNDSMSGLWSSNYTRAGFRNRYATRGGYPIYVFELIG